MTKKSKHLRKFLKVADRRLEDARYLLEAKRTVAAAYLAGYGVECLLKASLLSLVHEHEQPRTIATFRGSSAHDFKWLLTLYNKMGGAGLPRNIVGAFAKLDDWGVEMRYNPDVKYSGDIRAFFAGIDEVREWALRRLK